MSAQVKSTLQPQKRKVDVVVLGAGTAGLSARRAIKQEGKSVLMVDPGPLGTTCARVGCMPSKLLIAAADAAYHAKHGSIFGVHAENVRIEETEVLGRLQRERDRFVGFVIDVTDQALKQDELLLGRGRVLEPGTLAVDDHTLVEFDQLVVATGNRPFVPARLRDVQHLALSNEEVFELERFPESLLVIGVGVIGLELGQAFHRLGVRTTLLGIGGGVGPLTDPVVIREARQVLSKELDLHPDYELTHIEAAEDGVTIQFVDSNGRARSEHYQRILMAAGRTPNIDQLGLEHLGLTAEEIRKPNIDPDTLQLGDRPIFVAGDVNNLHPLLHEAADDGKIAGRNAALFPETRAATRRTPLTVVFSDPQIAVFGKTHRDLADCEAVAGEVDFGDQGRARVQGVNRGRVRLYADKRSGRLLGGELFAPRAEHLAHLLSWSVQQGMTVDRLLNMPFYHPVLEEGIRTALRDLNANLRRGAAIKCTVVEMGVGA